MQWNILYSFVLLLIVKKDACLISLCFINQMQFDFDFFLSLLRLFQHVIISRYRKKSYPAPPQTNIYVLSAVQDNFSSQFQFKNQLASESKEVSQLISCLTSHYVEQSRTVQIFCVCIPFSEKLVIIRVKKKVSLLISCLTSIPFYKAAPSCPNILCLYFIFREIS